MWSSTSSDRELEINAKKCLYEEVIVPTTLYRAKPWGMRSADRRKVNVLAMKLLLKKTGNARPGEGD